METYIEGLPLSSECMGGSRDANRSRDHFCVTLVSLRPLNHLVDFICCLHDPRQQ